jgi:hypothetical protein
MHKIAVWPILASDHMKLHICITVQWCIKNHYCTMVYQNPLLYNGVSKITIVQWCIKNHYCTMVYQKPMLSWNVMKVSTVLLYNELAILFGRLCHQDSPRVVIIVQEVTSVISGVFWFELNNWSNKKCTLLDRIIFYWTLTTLNRWIYW